MKHVAAQWAANPSRKNKSSLLVFMAAHWAAIGKLNPPCLHKCADCWTLQILKHVLHSNHGKTCGSRLKRRKAAMDGIPAIDHLNVWQLVQLLIAVAQALSRRLHGQGIPNQPPGLQQQVPLAGRVPQGQEMGEQPCTGQCSVCLAPCIRLERGHKHCKCRAHLRTR